jgi:hypothetical protein
MNGTEFKSNLKDSFRSSGLADKLRAQLRAKLVAELVLKTRSIKLESTPDDSIYTKVIDSLIVGYLKAMSYDFTVSVFLPESGQVKQLLSDCISRLTNPTADLTALLHLTNSNTLTSQINTFQNIPLLEKIIKALSLYTNLPTSTRETQTAEAEDMLEWTIRQTDKEAVLRNEQTHKISAMALEDRMMRYQRDVDARMETELESRVCMRLM